MNEWCLCSCNACSWDASAKCKLNTYGVTLTSLPSGWSLVLLPSIATRQDTATVVANFSVQKFFLVDEMSDLFYPPLSIEAWCWWCEPGCDAQGINHALSTRVLLKRKNMVLEYYNCVLCHWVTEETLLHLFLHFLLPFPVGIFWARRISSKGAYW